MTITIEILKAFWVNLCFFYEDTPFSLWIDVNKLEISNTMNN